MLESLRRAGRIHGVGGSAGATEHAGMAGCVAACVAGCVQMAAGQGTGPGVLRENVRVVLATGDVVAGQRYPFVPVDTNQARIDDAGVVSAFVPQQRELVVASGQGFLMFDPPEGLVPAGATRSHFRADALVEGALGQLVVRAQAGVQVGSAMVGEVFAGSFVRGARGQRTGRPRGVMQRGVLTFEELVQVASGAVPTFTELLFDSGSEFVSVGRVGDVIPGDRFGRRATGLRESAILPDGGLVLDYFPESSSRSGPSPSQVIYRDGQSASLPVPAGVGSSVCGSSGLFRTRLQYVRDDGGQIVTVEQYCVNFFGGFSYINSDTFKSGLTGSGPLFVPATFGVAPGGPFNTPLLHEILPDESLVAESRNVSLSSSGLVLVRNGAVQVIKALDGPAPFALDASHPGYVFDRVDVSDNGDVYYVFSLVANRLGLPRMLIARWNAQTGSEALLDTGVWPSGVGANPDFYVPTAAVDPRGGVVFGGYRYCDGSNCPGPNVAFGVYRVDSGGDGPRAVLVDGDRIRLPDGREAVVNEVRLAEHDASNTNHFGQILASVKFSELGGGALVLLETTRLCGADYNADGVLNPDDIGDYITAFYTMRQTGKVMPRLDANADGDVNIDDLGDYLTMYFAGCGAG